MTAFSTIMMLSLMCFLFLAGMWVGPDLFAHLGWPTPPAPVPKAAKTRRPVLETVMPLRAATPHVHANPRRRVVDAVKAVANEPLPTSPQDRKRAAQRKMILMLIAAIVYFLSPLDIVPDVFVGPGLLDDLGVLGIAGYQVWKEWKAVEIA